MASKTIELFSKNTCVGDIELHCSDCLRHCAHRHKNTVAFTGAIISSYHVGMI